MKIQFHKQLLLILPLLIGCNVAQAQDSAEKKPGINLADMDKKVKPSDDFYRFVNGNWIDKTEIPADKNSWGTGYELFENTNKDVAKILNVAIKNPKYKSNTDEGKAINLYKSTIDTLSRNKQGINPIKPYLAKIDAIKNIQDLQNVIVEMEPIGGIGFFGMSIGADDKDSNKNSVNIVPGKVGLPDRDYYVSEDNDSKEKRDKYVPRGYRKMRDEKKLERQVITNEQTNTHKIGKLDRFVKVMPNDFGPFEHNVTEVIYGDKMAFIDYNSETAMIIESKRIADFQRHIFKVLYKKL